MFIVDSPEAHYIWSPTRGWERTNELTLMSHLDPYEFQDADALHLCNALAKTCPRCSTYTRDGLRVILNLR
jgi:hypothetical protein